MTNNLTSQKIMENKKEKKYNQYLRPPTPTKQFLISPPASPPVGWAPCEEAKPVINDLSDLNYDLINKLAQLAPGEAHELHPQSDEHPAIVVHICEDDLNVNSKLNTPIIIESRDNSSDESDNEQIDKQPKLKIQKTRAPDTFLKSKDG